MGRECNCMKNTDKKKATGGIALILVAVASVIFALNGLINNSDYSSGLAIFGAIVFLYGIYLLVTCKSQCIYVPTGSILSHVTYYYDSSALLTLEKFIATGEGADSLPKAKSLGSLMLDIYKTKDDAMMCVQLSQYNDFSYVPTSEPIMMTDSRIQKICDYISNQQ